jgi:hypothetical protein
MKNLLSIESLSAAEIHQILELAAEMKSTRGRHAAHPLRHQCWALMFSKSSTRTRVSFEVGIRELGGDALFLSANDIQLGRGEPISDTARVLGRMVHGAVIRTFAQRDVEDFARYSGIPTINALTDDEHPCQILADLQTIQERLGGIDGKIVTFVGDGACNVPVSWMWAAAKLGFELRIAAPKPYQPQPELLARLGTDRVIVTDDLAAPRKERMCFTRTSGSAWARKRRPRTAATITRKLPGFHRTGRRPGSLFCLAPHGVCRAPALALRAVGSYPAFSPLPSASRLGRFVFCDTFRRARLSPDAPACFTRHAALWCSDFPLPAFAGSDHLLTGKFGEGAVSITPEESAASVAVEIALPDRTVSSRLKVLPPGTEPEEEIKTPFVPFPVALPEDPELLWVLGRREDLGPDEAVRVLAKIEEEFWATKGGQKLLRDRVERSFAEFIANVPAASLTESGLKRHYKEPETLKTLRRLGEAPKNASAVNAPVESKPDAQLAETSVAPWE